MKPFPYMDDMQTVPVLTIEPGFPIVRMPPQDKPSVDIRDPSYRPRIHACLFTFQAQQGFDGEVLFDEHLQELVAQDQTESVARQYDELANRQAQRTAWLDGLNESQFEFLYDRFEPYYGEEVDVSDMYARPTPGLFQAQGFHYPTPCNFAGEVPTVFTPFRDFERFSFDQKGYYERAVEQQELESQQQALVRSDAHKAVTFNWYNEDEQRWEVRIGKNKTVGNCSFTDYRKFTPWELKRLKCCHHINFFGRAITRKSGTSPATTVAVLMGKVKHLNVTTPNGLWKSTVMECATQLLDPVIFWGNPEDLEKLRGTKLENACIGVTAKSYVGLGWWVNDYYSEEEYCPQGDPLDPSCWPGSYVVFNGVTVTKGSRSRLEIIEASQKEKLKEDSIRQAALRARMDRGRVRSRLGLSCIKQEDLTEVPTFTCVLAASQEPLAVQESPACSVEAASPVESSQPFEDKIAEHDAESGFNPIGEDWGDDVDEEQAQHLSSEEFNKKIAEQDARAGYQPLVDWADDDDDENQDDGDGTIDEEAEGQGQPPAPFSMDTQVAPTVMPQVTLWITLPPPVISPPTQYGGQLVVRQPQTVDIWASGVLPTQAAPTYQFMLNGSTLTATRSAQQLNHLLSLAMLFGRDARRRTPLAITHDAGFETVHDWTTRNEIPAERIVEILDREEEIIREIAGTIISPNVTLTRDTDLTVAVISDISPELIDGDDSAHTSLLQSDSSTPPTSADSCPALSQHDDGCPQVDHASVRSPFMTTTLSANLSMATLRRLVGDAGKYLSPSSCDQWPDFDGLHCPTSVDDPVIPVRTSSLGFSQQSSAVASSDAHPKQGKKKKKKKNGFAALCKKILGFFRGNENA